MSVANIDEPWILEEKNAHATIVFNVYLVDEGSLEGPFQKGCIHRIVKCTALVVAQFTIVSAEPDPALPVLFKEKHLIVRHAIKRGELFKLYAVVPRYAFVGSQPDETLAATVYIVNRIAGEPIFRRIMYGWKFLA
jgi:hypothetical protein